MSQDLLKMAATALLEAAANQSSADPSAATAVAHATLRARRPANLWRASRRSGDDTAQQRRRAPPAGATAANPNAGARFAADAALSLLRQCQRQQRSGGADGGDEAAYARALRAAPPLSPPEVARRAPLWRIAIECSQEAYASGGEARPGERGGGACPPYVLRAVPAARLVVLAFRGSSSVHDWLSNLGAVPVPFDNDDLRSGERAHAGLVSAARAAVDGAAVRDALHMLRALPSYSLLVTGHSRGGGVALAVGVFLLRRARAAAARTVPHSPYAGLESRLRVVGVGAPPVFSSASVFPLGDGGREIFANLVCDRDPVPRAQLHTMARAVLHGVLGDRGRSQADDDVARGVRGFAGSASRLSGTALVQPPGTYLFDSSSGSSSGSPVVVVRRVPEGSYLLESADICAETISCHFIETYAQRFEQAAAALPQEYIPYSS